MGNLNILWTDKKRTIFGLPISFTKYRLTDDKLLTNKGFFTIIEEEVKLYRILDITLTRTLFQRMFNVGTIHCCSADVTTPEFDIVSVKNPSDVKELLSKMVEQQRSNKNVSTREFFNSSEEHEI